MIRLIALVALSLSVGIPIAYRATGGSLSVITGFGRGLTDVI